MDAGPSVPFSARRSRTARTPRRACGLFRGLLNRLTLLQLDPQFF